MEFPPKSKTPYRLENEQDKIIFDKLAKFEDKKLGAEDEELVKFLYSQLEDDWRAPLEKFVDKLFNEKQTKMGFHKDIVREVFDGKICTWRLRDHKLKVGDVVAFENSQTGEIFGRGEITKVVATTVGKIDLNDKSHYKTYKTRQELIDAFKRHNLNCAIKNDTSVYAYTYKFKKNSK